MLRMCQRIVMSGLILVLLLTMGGCQVSGGDDSHPMNRLLAKIIPESPSVSWRKLAEHLRSPDADLRRRGVLMLQKKVFREQDAALELIEIVATGDPDENVRRTAVEVLSLIDEKQTIMAKIYADRGEKDPSAVVRGQVMRIIAEKGYAWGKEIALAGLSRDDAAEVRIQAAQALGHYADSEVISPLIDALQDEEFAVCYHARNALEALTGKRFGDDPEAWRNWYNDTDSDKLLRKAR